MFISCLLTLIICIPLVWVLLTLTCNCKLGKLFKSKSKICEALSPSAPNHHGGTPSATHGSPEDPIDMEEKLKQLEDELHTNLVDRVDNVDKNSLEEKKNF